MGKVADVESDAVFAEEALVVDVQIFLHTLMEHKNVSRAELARRMGVSRARVTQMLSDDCSNLTVRLLARATHALGEVVELDCRHFRASRSASRHSAAVSASNITWLQEAAWVDDCGHVCDEGDERLQAYFALSSERLAA